MTGTDFAIVAVSYFFFAWRRRCSAHECAQREARVHRAQRARAPLRRSHPRVATAMRFLADMQRARRRHLDVCGETLYEQRRRNLEALDSADAPRAPSERRVALDGRVSARSGGGGRARFACAPSAESRSRCTAWPTRPRESTASKCRRHFRLRPLTRRAPSLVLCRSLSYCVCSHVLLFTFV